MGPSIDNFGHQTRSFQFDRVTRLGRGSAKPVFAVMHSNGAFLPLGHAIGAQHPFVALQSIGRHSSERLPGTIEEIAASYVRQLRAAEPAGPYVLLGWCLAGNIAYEAAQQLRAAGETVAAVVMVDSWNPAYLERMSHWRRLLAERSYGWQIILTEFVKVLRGTLSPPEFLHRRRTIRRLVQPPKPATGPLSPAAASYLADQAFDTALLAQLTEASRRYRPRAYPGAVLRIRSSEEPSGFGLDRQYGWGGLVGEALRVITIPGDHLSIFLEPSVSLLTRHVQALLPQVD